MNTIASHLPTPAGRALVLGGGGSTGHAWLIGVVAGLLESGLDVTDADLVVGTSAASTAAVHVLSRDARDLLAETLDAPTPPSSGPHPGVSDHVDRLRRTTEEATGPEGLRRLLGERALARTTDEATERWRQVVASRLGGATWPDRDLRITAVDADSGEPVVFHRDSGVDLVDAVAASCSSGFAYEIEGHRYIDGGFRTNAENADLASGYARVLVLSPFGGPPWTPLAWGPHLSPQVDRLRGGGSEGEGIAPRPEEGGLFGGDAMDLRPRPAAARAGHEQARELAGDLGAFWSAR